MTVVILYSDFKATKSQMQIWLPWFSINQHNISIEAKFNSVCHSFDKMKNGYDVCLSISIIASKAAFHDDWNENNHTVVELFIFRNDIITEAGYLHIFWTFQI